MCRACMKKRPRTLIEAFLRDPQLSDFWNDTQNITLLQDNLRVAVQQVTDLQGQLQDQEQASKADTKHKRGPRHEHENPETNSS